MSIKYILPGKEEKPKYVKEKFDEIASKYNLFNDLITFGMHRYWKKFLVTKTGISHDGVVLDLCCGTGDITRYLANYAPQGRVYALDFSSEMIKTAQNRLQNKYTRLTLMRGDAMKIPISNESMDAVTIGYGLRNVKDLKQCLEEILRILKPGGKLLCLDIGKIRIPIIKQIAQFYLFHVVPQIGQLIMPRQEMFQYLPHSSINYPSQEKLKDIMYEVGFNKVEYFDFLFGITTIHSALK